MRHDISYAILLNVTRTGPNAADWWIVAISAFAAVVSLAATAAAAVSARPAMRSAEVLHEEREQERRERRAEPLKSIRRSIATYRVTSDDAQQEAQRGAAVTIAESDLGRFLPHTVAWSKSGPTTFGEDPEVASREAWKEVGEALDEVTTGGWWPRNYNPRPD